MTPARLTERIASASAWSVASEGISATGRALAYFAYAKLLTPADFGLVGICLLIGSFFPSIIDNTAALTLIRSERTDQRIFSTIFILNVGLSIIVCIALISTAPELAHAFKDPRISSILPLVTLQLPLQSLASTHLAIAKKNFEYRKLLPVRLIPTVLSVAVGLPMAFEGFGYWALVSASLTAALFQAIVTWLIIPWRFSWTLDFKGTKDLLGFSGWISVDMAVTWLVMSGGSFFLQGFLGSHDLGLYRLSDQLNTYLIGTILTPLIPVLYSAFCEARSDTERLRRLSERALAIVALLALTTAGVLVVISRPLQALLGSRWLGLGQIIALNAVADGISYAMLPVPSLMRANGRASAVAVLRLLMVAAQIAVFSVVAKHGLGPFLWAKVAIEAAVYVLTYIVLKSQMPISIHKIVFEQLRHGAVILGCALGVLYVTRPLMHSNAVAVMLASLCIYCPVLGIYFFAMERGTIAWVWTLRNR